MVNFKSKLYLKASYFFYVLLVGLPFFVLYLFPREESQIDPQLFAEALENTLVLSVSVLLLSTLIGCGFAFVQNFYDYPLKKTIHLALMLPLAFPAYVMAFIYLGLLGPSSPWSFFELQGELWFLTLVLVFSLTPYIYFFTSLGLRFVTQGEL